MEVASLALGIAGLAAICLELIEHVETYQTFGAHSRQLNARFEASRLRLREWTVMVGIVDGKLIDHHNERLDIPEVASVVKKILSSVCEVFGKVEEIQKKLQLPTGQTETQALTWSTLPSRVQESGKSTGLPPHLGRRLQWTVKGKNQFTDQVDMLEALVNGLYDTVPPTSVQIQGTGDVQNHVSEKTLKDIHDTQRSLKLYLQEITQKAVQQAYKSIEEWLDVKKIDNQYEKYILDRVEGTCDWILNETAYCDWSSQMYPGRAAKFLWLHGPAGHGKSILCARLYQKLASDDAATTAYLSVTSHVQIGGQPREVPRYWIYQMARTNDMIFDIVRDGIQANQSQYASEIEVWNILKDIASRVDNCVFVIDGLDEYGRTESGRKDFLRNLKTALAGTRSRCLIVSRPEIDIELELKQAVIEEKRFAMFECKITPTALQADIERYSDHVVKTQLPKKEEEFRHRLAAEMAGKCEGMFLWIKLQQDQLRGGKSKKALWQIVERMPTGLSQSYDRNWKTIENLSEDDRDRAISILRWTTFALRPLTISEITEALVVEADPEATTFSYEDLPDEIDEDYIDSEIKHLCNSLVEIRSANPTTSPNARTIQVIHPSVREYLMTVLPIPILLEPYSKTLSPTECHHTLLAKICIRYLNFSNIWTSEHTSFEHQGRTSFVDYATLNWDLHCDTLKCLVDELSDEINGFFDLHNENFAAWAHRCEDDKFIQQNTTGASQMYYASLFGLTSTIMYLQDRYKINLDLMGGPYGTALHAACAAGRPEVFKLLTELGANINLMGGLFGTALNAAIASQHNDMALELIKKGADVATKGQDGCSPLFYATLTGDAAIVSSLLTAGATPDDYNMHGQTLLLRAIANNNAEIVKLLLDHGASTSMNDTSGWFPVCYASYKGHLEILKLLLAHGAEGSNTLTSDWAPLHFAADAGHTEIVSLLLEHGVDVSCKGPMGQEPLHLAAQLGSPAIVGLLLDHGAVVSSIDEFEWTPLHLAVKHGHLEVCKLLVDRGAHFSSGNRHGWTALHFAANSGFSEAVEFLLGKYACDVPREEMSIAINLAASGGYTKIVKMLLVRDANVLCEGITGRRALHTAAYNGHCEIVETLLTRGVPISSAEDDAFTALHSAAEGGQVAVVKLLLNHGADINAQDQLGTTALKFAITRGHESCIDVLLSHGADLYAIDVYGRSCLYWLRLLGSHLENFPEWKTDGLKDVQEDIQKTYLLQSIRKIALSKQNHEQKAGRFSVLGRCLMFLGMYDDARLAFHHASTLEQGGNGQYFQTVCDFCDKRIEMQNRSVCQTCPDVDKCSSCGSDITKTDHAVCRGHEFLSIDTPIQKSLPVGLSDMALISEKLEYWSTLQASDVKNQSRAADLPVREATTK